MCRLSGAVDLYFYGELRPPSGATWSAHLRACDECRARARRSANDPRGAGDASGRERAARRRLVVVHGAPPAGDRSGAARRRVRAAACARYASATSAAGRSSRDGGAAHARDGERRLSRAAPAGTVPDRTAASVRPPAASAASTRVESPSATAGESDAAFAAVSEQHFERSKLVILGLANKNPQTTTPPDWAYERQLAGCAARRHAALQAGGRGARARIAGPA